ncbi:LamG domain-containing protein, partial [Streptomyces sp. ACA25]|uniref:LamG domain-containing protein n=1 Tax=Streptomyces sp. ACA25 TaxID=3022596 RepID=UPI002307972B
MTFGLRAGNETSNLHWKRFRYDAHLRVSYNRPPRQIKTSQLTMEYGGACKSSSAPVHVRTMGKIYANNVTDPDGDSVRVQFRIFQGSEQVWTSGLTTAKKSGSSFAVNLPNSLAQNATLRWSVRAYDGHDYGPWSSSGFSCHFVHNTSIPQAPTITSGQYPASDPAHPEDPWYNGVGQYGDFTLAASDTDVTRYRFGVNGDPSTANQVSTTSGAAVTVRALPEKPGLHFLTAQAVDGAGNLSEIRTYQFRVGAGREQRVTWALDEGTGATQAEAAVPERVATVHGAADFAVDGVVGTAMQLDGSSGYVATSEPVVDTNRSFTVSAWVKLDEKPGRAAIIATQAGIHRPGFELYYSAAQDKWAFNQYRNDDPADTRTARALADTEVKIGEWTHLVGSHDPVHERLRLFVNGQLAGHVDYSEPWNARGEVQVGASQHNGQPGHYFPGVIDEVQIFNHVMRSANTQVAQLYNKERIHHATGRPAVALLDLDEAAGATEVSAAADALPAVFEGGADPGVPGPDGNALRLNGTDAYAWTTAGHLNTGRNFAVSAWAKLDKTKADTAGIIATQVASHRPGFELYYSSHYDRWAFNQYSSNSPDATPVRAMQPAGTSARGDEWVHLVGVHDTYKDTLTLYVNGRKTDTTTLGGAFHANGYVQIGAGQYSGEVKSFFPGEIS